VSAAGNGAYIHAADRLAPSRSVDHDEDCSSPQRNIELPAANTQQADASSPPAAFGISKQ